MNKVDTAGAGGPRRITLLIRHAYVITMDDDQRIFADGAIAIDGGRIVEVGDDAAVVARYVAARVIDAKGAPAHPGFIECHLHASFQLFGALPDQLAESDAFDSFESLFFNTVNDEEEYLAVALAAIEMIRNGTTCFLEAGTVLEPAAAARAAEEVGIRAVLADPFIWDQPAGLRPGHGRGRLRRLRCRGSRAPDAGPRAPHPRRGAGANGAGTPPQP